MAVDATSAVRLHIYDLTSSRIVKGANKVLRPVGTGAFHAAIEVFGKEWSFGFCDTGTGVYSCAPKKCSLHKYRETVDLGETDLSEKDFSGVLREMRAEWQGENYDMLRHNCLHFSQTLAAALHVKELPYWVVNLAHAGAAVRGLVGPFAKPLCKQSQVCGKLLRIGRTKCLKLALSVSVPKKILNGYRLAGAPPAVKA